MKAVPIGRVSPHPPLEALARSRIALLAYKAIMFGVLAFVVGVLLLVATATAPALFGYHTYTIDGNSMEPALRKGSVAVTSPTSPRALRAGDIIAYRQSPENPPVLHRIVAVTYEDGEPRFITQGDKNSAPDPEAVALEGPGDRAVYSVPYAGYVVHFGRSTLGRVLLIGIPAPVLLVLLLMPARRPRRAVRSSTQPASTAPPAFERRPSLEAQALQLGLSHEEAAAPGRVRRPSLADQALQLSRLGPRPQQAPPIALASLRPDRSGGGGDARRRLAA